MMLLQMLCFGVLSAEPVLVDRVIAVVNDESITLIELQEQVASAMRAAKTIDQAVRKRLEKELLAVLIERRLLELEAKRLHLSVSDRDVDRGIAGVAKARGATTSEVTSAAEQELGLFPRQYREAARFSLIEAQLLDKVGTPKSESQVERDVRRARTREELLLKLKAGARIVLSP